MCLIMFVHMMITLPSKPIRVFWHAYIHKCVTRHLCLDIYKLPVIVKKHRQLERIEEIGSSFPSYCH